MTLQTKKYKNFQDGKQGYQFLNNETHQVYEALKQINYRKNENKYNEPDCNIDGGLWFDKTEGCLKYYDLHTSTWNNVFDKKFQITDQILNEITPASPVNGQLWLYNETLMFFNGSEWKPVKTVVQDNVQWSNAAFEDYTIVTPLNPVNSIVVDLESNTYESAIETLKSKIDDDFSNTNFILKLDGEELEEYNSSYTLPEIPVGSVPEEYPEDFKSQYLIPNIKTDRVFVNSTLDNTYETVSTVCFQYPTNSIKDKTISAIHMNHGKVTNIAKRLIKIDKANTTIFISPVNTEFYGFRRGEETGHFLIESNNQDYGDYIVNSNYIILNYDTVHNYDYILAVTFDFSWLKATGAMNKYIDNGQKTKFYLSNLNDLVNVHADGLKLEESIYEIDKISNTVTINDEYAKDSEIQIWSPYDKQFGYIREIDLDGNGIIKLQRRVHIPLVFVGGVLIHPLYGGLKFNKEKNIITVPNVGGLDTMRNMSWCVVDLLTTKIINEKDENGYIIQRYEYDIMHSEKGRPVTKLFSIDNKDDKYDIENGEYIADADEVPADDNDFDTFKINGTHVADADEEIQDDNDIDSFIISSGSTEFKEEVIIPYSKNKIKDDEGIILFVDGLMVSSNYYEVNREESYIKVYDKLEQGKGDNYEPLFGITSTSEYLLLRDKDGSLYNSSNLTEAIYTGLLDDSMVYLNGKILCNKESIQTTNDEHYIIANGVVDKEIKRFIYDPQTSDGEWKIYNQFNNTWEALTEFDQENVDKLVGTYSNQINSIAIRPRPNPDKEPPLYNSEYDELLIYSFRFANSSSGNYKISTAIRLSDNENGNPVYALNSVSYSNDSSCLNVFKNGVKLIENVDYVEVYGTNQIQLLSNYDEIGEDDLVQFFVEPLELGETDAKETVILTNKNMVQQNIYKLEESENTISLYPGRLTIYINGLRLPKEDWMLLDNKTILVKYDDYQAIGSKDNYPVQKYFDGKISFDIKHNYSDNIVVEIRKDYDRNEKTINLKSFESNQGMELYVEDYNIPKSILDSTDEALFYMNGQFLGLARSSGDYKFDQYKGCIKFLNSKFLESISTDPLNNLFKNNNNIYTAWKENTGKSVYEPNVNNKLTIVWR